MIMNFSSISERKQSLTGLLLVIAAIASLVVAAANCLPIGGDEPSKQVGQESAQKVINRPDLETNPTSNNSWSANLDSNEGKLSKLDVKISGPNLDIDQQLTRSIQLAKLEQV